MNFERNRWDGICHACPVLSWTDPSQTAYEIDHWGRCLLSLRRCIELGGVFSEVYQALTLLALGAHNIYFFNTTENEPTKRQETNLFSVQNLKWIRVFSPTNVISCRESDFNLIFSENFSLLPAQMITTWSASLQVVLVALFSLRVSSW